MQNNINLFNFSLNNPEPIIDESYLKSDDLIISEKSQNPTMLMQQNLDLLESISAYNFAKKNNNQAIAKKAIKNIFKVIKSKNINYSEFISFWPVLDISYSTFNEMTDRKQLEILEILVEKYIKWRHNLYSNYGYTPITLQAGKDAKSHKRSGNLGVNKVSKLLDSAGFKKANTETKKDFIQGNKKYIQADKKGKKLFKDLLDFYKIKFSWSLKKQEKMPDFLIRYKDDIFILEHKHMKESGGGQNKQIEEIISLISFNESNKKIHFISFLDGIYFNLFFNKKYLNKGKVLNQFNNIKKELEHHNQNYFVNTAGFKKFIETLN